MLNLEPLLKRLALFRRALRLIWDATGTWTLFWGGLLVLQGALPALAVYVSKVLVDRLAVIIGTGYTEEAIGQLMGPLLLIGAVLLLTQVL